MACSVEIKTTNFLRKEGVIDGNLNIIDNSLVKDYMGQLNKMAYMKYGVGITGSSLYSIVNNKLVPDTKLFDLLDESTFASEVQKIYKNRKGLKDVKSVEDTNVFEEQKNEEKDVEYETDAFLEKSLDLTKLANKVDYTLNKVRQSLLENIKRLKKITYNSYVKDSIKENAANKIEVLKELMAELEQNKDGVTASGLTNFVDKSIANINYINSRLISVDFSDSKNIRLLLESYDNYLSSFSVIEDVQQLITEFGRNKKQKYLTKEELNLLSNRLKVAAGTFQSTNQSLLLIKKEYSKNKLTDVKYFPRIMNKHRARLKKEWENIGKPGDMDSFINKHISPEGKDWDLILEDVDQAVDELFENPVFDILWADNQFTSPSNISNELFQIFHRQLIEIDNQRLAVERQEDVKLSELFSALRKHFGTTNVKTLYKNIIEKDSDGRMFLKGEFKVDFLKQVTEEIKKLKKEGKIAESESLANAVKIRNQYGLHSSQYLEAQKQVKKVNEEWVAKVKRIENQNLDLQKDGSFLPKSKWRNNLSGLSTPEKNILDYFKSVVDKGHKANYKESLRVQSYGALFYDTPYITKSSMERIYEGNIKGAIKEKYDYLVEKRADDTEYTNDQVDISGERIRELRLHYRNRNNNFKHQQQSEDLSTMFRMEFKNVNTYNLRREKEADFNFLIDIAKYQKLYKREGSFIQRAFNKENLHISTDLNNNIAKNLQNMMDYRFYDIANKVNKKFGKTDLNKATNYINGSTAFMALAFNFASGTANVVNANAQMFLETVFKGSTFTSSNVAKANKIYFNPSVLGDTLKDYSNPINTGFVNQISEIFNTKGLYALSESNFLQSTLAKKGLDLKSLQVFQDSGEHWIHSVLVMSVLDNVKVLNSNAEFIDINGKVVKTKKQAASLLDMHKVDKSSGLVNIDPNVVYTTHSPSVKYTEGGKELIDILIDKKLNDTIGNYTQTRQAEGFRHYGFKMLMLFRKYLVPMGQARLLGFENSLIAKEKLREDQRRFSHALQEYEEGTYTTFIRYGFNSLKTLKKELLTRENWDNLTEYEKHNIKRATVELMMTFVILPNLIRLLAMGAATDDEPEKWYFMMYQTRRNIMELQAYINPVEMFKMLKSPIPSVRFIEGGLNTMYHSFPTNWFDEDGKGNNMWLKSVNQFNPGRQFTKDFQSTFNYYNR